MMNKKLKYTFITISIILLLFITSGLASWIVTNSKSFKPKYVIDGDIILSLDNTSVTYDNDVHIPALVDNPVIDFKNDDIFSNYYFSYKDLSTNTTSAIYFDTAYVPYDGPVDAGDYEIYYKNKETNEITTIPFTIEPVKLTEQDLSEYLPSLGDTVYGELPSMTQQTGNFLTYTFPSNNNSEKIGGNFVFEDEESTKKNVYVGTAASCSVSTNILFYPNNTNYIFESSIKCYYNLKAVAYSGQTYFGRVETAVQKISKGTIYVIPSILDSSGNLLPVNVTESIVIPNELTLNLPYEGTTLKSSAAYSTIGNTIADSTEALVKENRTILMKLHEDVTITINEGGTLQIGSVFNRIGVAGKYAEINLDLGASITCSGTLNCYGYIKENSENAINTTSNNINDNSCDEGRFLEITNTGSLLTVLAIKDETSGGPLTALAKANTCPINEFDFPCIQTYSIYKSGSKVDCLVRVTAASNDLEKQINVVRSPSGSSSGSDAVFNVKSGDLVLEYTPKTAGITINNETGDFTKVIVNGDLEIGYLYFDVTVAEIDTRLYPLPISYKIQLVVNEYSTLKTIYQIKFLPGSSILIEENGTLDINSNFMVYKASDIDGITSDDDFAYPHTLNDAKLINNGLITLNGDGKIGADIKHTNTKNTAIIDLTDTVQSDLSSTTCEGTTQKEVIIASTASFYVDNTYVTKQIAADQALYSRRNDTNYYWEGNYFDTFTIDILISDHNYEFPIYNYTIMYADDANGTNATLLSPTNATGIASYDVIYGKYINVVVERENVSFLTLGNTTYTINSSIESKWHKVVSDGVIEITPNEGVKIYINTSGNSGAGKVEYTVYEAPKGSSTFVEVGSTTTGSVTTYVIKNYQFKFTTHSDYGYYFTTKRVIKDGVDIGVHGKENSQSNSDSALGNNTIYIADGNYSFNFGWNFQTCVTKDTLITLADGSQKRVDELARDEIIRVWDHELGGFANVKIGWIIKHDNIAIKHNIINLKFNNGINLKLIGSHALFNLTQNEYIMISPDNAKEYIGDDFVFDNGENIERIKLIDVDIYQEETIAYSIVSSGTINAFTNGILSSTPQVETLLNGFGFDNETLKYVNYEEEVQKYGYYSYEELSHLLTYEEYEITNAKKFKILIGKGVITWEELLDYIQLIKEMGKYFTE